MNQTLIWVSTYQQEDASDPCEAPLPNQNGATAQCEVDG